MGNVFGSHLANKNKAGTAIDSTNVLFKRYAAMVALIFALSSISPAGAFYDNAYSSPIDDFAGTSSFEAVLLTDEEGYLTKINPQTDKGDRSTMTDRAEHKVAAGETLSTIAAQYGVKTQTVLWENNIGNANSIRVGQKLYVPPVDGVSHKVAKGETLEKIAKKYSVEVGAIQKQNKLIASTVSVGEEVFIPDGKPISPVISRTTPARVGTSSRVGTVALADSSSVPAGSKPFIFPTRGKITQGWRRGHYAFDIADASKPPIWAAGGGTVTKASSGTWGGGYGTHIIIDHGNGLQTLYAHMDYLSVSVGENVTQGQVIGRMGRTGRVYGRTGIHLHFEVIKNGVKQYPSNYY